MTRLLTPFILPAGAIGIIWAAGIVLAVRGKPRKRAALAVLGAGLALFYLLSTWPLAGLLIGSLQSAPPSPEAAGGGGIEAVVILSGGISISPWAPAVAELEGATWRRLDRGAEVFRAFEGKVPVIYSGRERLPESLEGTVEPPARTALGRLGIAGSSLEIEDRSENTGESALEVRKILDGRHPGTGSHRVALVTSAWHLPRARRAFEAQGIAVRPEPADFRSGPAAFGLGALVPSYEALAASSVAIREWAGIAAYRLLGRS